MIHLLHHLHEVLHALQEAYALIATLIGVLVEGVPTEGT